MRRRDKTAGKKGKTQRRQMVRRPNTAKVAHRQPPAVDGAERIALLTRERDEALEQQTATSEVLKVISSSPGELEPVFNAILENATRICEAKFGTLYRYDGAAFYPVTFHKVPSSFADFLRKRSSFVPPSGTPLDRLLRTKEVIRTADDSAAEIPSPSARLAGAKSHIAVPMFKDDQLAGPSLSTARKCVPSLTSKSRWSRVSPIRPSSPSRTPACSKSCTSAPTI